MSPHELDFAHHLVRPGDIMQACDIMQFQHLRQICGHGQACLPHVLSVPSDPTDSRQSDWGLNAAPCTGPACPESSFTTSIEATSRHTSLPASLDAASTLPDASNLQLLIALPAGTIAVVDSSAIFRTSHSRMTPIASHDATMLPCKCIGFY